MSKIMIIVLEWKYPTIPLGQYYLRTIKDIIKTLKKQLTYHSLHVFTNSEEYAFLNADHAHYFPGLSKTLAKNHPVEYFSLQKTPPSQFLWISLQPHAKTPLSTDLVKYVSSSYWTEFSCCSQEKKIFLTPLNKKKILLRADGGINRGTGHLYRVLTLAELLIQKGCHVSMSTMDNQQFNLGRLFFQNKDLPIHYISTEEDFQNLVKKISPHLLVLDILNTDREYIQPLLAYAEHIISFENLGDGTFLMDFTINDLYTHPLLPQKKQYSGLKYSLLNQYFINALRFVKPIYHPEIRTILILFGGTDPSHLTQKTLQALTKINFTGKVVLIQNFQQEQVTYHNFPFTLVILKKVAYMPQYMHGVDLAISSAGRSILELISMSIPTLCLSQNQKELMHTHNIGSNGILPIGLGEFLDPSIIAQYILLLQNHPELRRQLYLNALRARKQFSNQRIVQKILNLLK